MMDRQLPQSTLQLRWMIWSEPQSGHSCGIGSSNHGASSRAVAVARWAEVSFGA